MAFFERVRVALTKAAPGLHDAGPPAGATALSALERRAGPIPPGALDLLRSYDGLRLYHETVTLLPAAEVGRRPDGWWVIGEAPEGRLLCDAEGRVLLEDEAGDRVLGGSTIERFLEAVLAREGLLTGPDGEWRDVFGDDGALKTDVRRRRARAGMKADPAAAVWPFEAAELAFELGQAEEGERELEHALALDPHAAAAWELLAARGAASGRAEEAARGFERAAERTAAGPRRARRFAEAARAAKGNEAARLSAQARAAEAGCGARFSQDAGARLAVGDADGACHLYELAAAVGEPGADERARALRARAKLRLSRDR
jgi:hypothetical protein